MELGHPFLAELIGFVKNLLFDILNQTIAHPVCYIFILSIEILFCLIDGHAFQILTLVHIIKLFVQFHVFRVILSVGYSGESEKHDGQGNDVDDLASAKSVFGSTAEVFTLDTGWIGNLKNLWPNNTIQVLLLQPLIPARDHVKEAGAIAEAQVCFEFLNTVHALKLDEHHNRGRFTISLFLFHYKILLYSLVQ